MHRQPEYSSQVMHMTKPFTSSKKSTGFYKPHVSKYTPFNLFKLCKDKEKNNEKFSESPIYSTIMNSKCFVHKEGNNFSTQVKIHYLPVSKSFPAEAKEILEILSDDNISDKWVSLPAYESKDGNMRVHDFQLATTGTKSSTEHLFSATSERECCEENGINVCDANLVNVAELKHSSKHVEAFVYYVGTVEPAREIEPVAK